MISMLLLAATQAPATQPTSGQPIAPQGTAAQPTEPTAAQATAALAHDIWKRLSFYANGRLRAESTFDQPNGEDRHRGRMRFRVGGTYDITDNLLAEARLSTTADGNDANNPYWDFGDGADAFQAADIRLDRFLLDWKAFEGLSLRGGKFGHAFSRPPVYSEFVWDDDVQPAGVAAVWSPPRDGALGFDLRAVEYIAVENGGDDDPAMFGVQANGYAKVGDATELQLASSLSDWSSLNASTGQLGNQGNTDVTGDFAIWDSFASITWKGGAVKQVTAFVQYMNNIDADTSEDSGYALGAQIGPSGGKGNGNVFAAYYDLDADSVFSPVAQDDTPIPGTGIGTGMDGIILGGQIYVLENLSVRLWGLTSDADASDDPYRLRLDIDFRVL
jgi:hypothetical protein